MSALDRVADRVGQRLLDHVVAVTGRLVSPIAKRRAKAVDRLAVLGDTLEAANTRSQAKAIKITHLIAPWLVDRRLAAM